jgi:tetratricopeptide (TPR) repeat protein
MRTVADAVTTNSPDYLKLISKAAEYDPSFNYDLADYSIGRHEDDKAAQYYEKACETDPDSVRVSQYAQWRIRYYLKHGKTEAARKIADDAGEVYSYAGLHAKAVFFELASNYNGAFDYYEKIETRYDDSVPLLDFCMGFKSRTADKRFDKEVQSRMSNMFPHGTEKAALAQFTSAPNDGVLIQQSNDLVKSAGLKVGDVIVAAQGMRVHNMRQYTYARETRETAELDLIVWQGQGYREIKASPPHHRFGVNFGDYTTQLAKTGTQRR